MQSAHDELGPPRAWSLGSLVALGVVATSAHAMLVVACWPNMSHDLGLSDWLGLLRYEVIAIAFASVLIGCAIACVTLFWWRRATSRERPRGLALAILALPVALLFSLGALGAWFVTRGG